MFGFKCRSHLENLKKSPKPFCAKIIKLELKNVFFSKIFKKQGRFGKNFSGKNVRFQVLQSLEKFEKIA